MQQSANKFSLQYYVELINLARDHRYTFYTVDDFLKANCPSTKAFVIKHDIDAKPEYLSQLIDVEKELNVRSTLFVRVAGAEYNPLGYSLMKTLLRAADDDFEIGLHTNFIEYAKILDLNPIDILIAEVDLIRRFFDIKGIACHRDFNYAYNSLPWVQENWKKISETLSLKYEAYDERIMSATHYINEGYVPHLGWRNHKPEEIIAQGNSIYLLTHPHFWYKDHPFEH